MRAKEEIRADIEAEQNAQDAALKLIAYAYLRNYDNFVKWMNKLSSLSYLTKDTDDAIYKAVFFLGNMSHDAEPSRLNFERRRQVLDRLYKEMGAWRKAQKSAGEDSSSHD